MKKNILGELAYAMAVNINRSFKIYGWCASIRGVEIGRHGGQLPCHTVSDR